MTTAIDTATPTVPLPRLAHAEFRKAINTRGSRWFLSIVLAIVAGGILIQALVVPEGMQDLGDFTFIASTILGVFIPIVPILLVTQEWGQRTGLTTFGLEPRRWRVMAAKLTATLALASAAVALALVLASIGAALAGGVRSISVSWALDAAAVRNLLIGNLLAAVLGFAFATLVRHAAIAMAGMFLYIFAVPTLLAVMAGALPWFEGIRPWLDFAAAQEPLLSAGTLTATQWAHLGISTLVWIVAPLVLGLWRIRRAEIK